MFTLSIWVLTCHNHIINRNRWFLCKLKDYTEKVIVTSNYDERRRKRPLTERKNKKVICKIKDEKVSKTIG